MTPLNHPSFATKCTLATALWVAGICAFTGCGVERNVTIPKSSFDRLLGAPSATDTNLIARIDAIAIALNREILLESNNWFHAGKFINTMDERVKALEAKLAPLPGPPAAAPQVYAPGYIPPLQSAPVIPPLEKP